MRARIEIDLSALMPRDGLNPPKLILLGLVFLHLVGTVFDPERAHWVSGIIFYTHEAGHLIFRPMGDFLTIAGGTALQLLVPIAFSFHFARQGQWYSAAIVCFWLAMSLIDVSVYAGDAIAMQRPLSTSWTSGAEELENYGETGHDWFNMLTSLGLLRPWAVGLISSTWYLVGVASFVVATYGALLTAGVPLRTRFNV